MKLKQYRFLWESVLWTHSFNFPVLIVITFLLLILIFVGKLVNLKLLPRCSIANCCPFCKCYHITAFSITTTTIFLNLIPFHYHNFQFFQSISSLTFSSASICMPMGRFSTLYPQRKTIIILPNQRMSINENVKAKIASRGSEKQKKAQT